MSAPRNSMLIQGVWDWIEGDQLSVCPPDLRGAAASGPENPASQARWRVWQNERHAQSFRSWKWMGSGLSKFRGGLLDISTRGSDLATFRSDVLGVRTFRFRGWSVERAMNLGDFMERTGGSADGAFSPVDAMDLKTSPSSNPTSALPSHAASLTTGIRRAIPSPPLDNHVLTHPRHYRQHHRRPVRQPFPLAHAAAVVSSPAMSILAAIPSFCLPSTTNTTRTAGSPTPPLSPARTDRLPDPPHLTRASARLSSASYTAAAAPAVPPRRRWWRPFPCALSPSSALPIHHLCTPLNDFPIHSYFTSFSDARVILSHL
ncbi:hypothetical protein K438DRAFT_1982034 [Mycena galopus ATCC 62051]|nr:hypothetical protein K438DRAFT_1982034 [Mycena galopus ATCC 62051]